MVPPITWHGGHDVGHVGHTVCVEVGGADMMTVLKMTDPLPLYVQKKTYPVWACGRCSSRKTRTHSGIVQELFDKAFH